MEASDAASGPMKYSTSDLADVHLPDGIQVQPFDDDKKEGDTVNGQVASSENDGVQDVKVVVDKQEDGKKEEEAPLGKTIGKVDSII